MPEESAKTTPTTDKQTNCPACGKAIKKLRRYYRNGKFYCSKKCYRNFTKSKVDQKS